MIIKLQFSTSYRNDWVPRMIPHSQSITYNTASNVMRYSVLGWVSGRQAHISEFYVLRSQTTVPAQHTTPIVTQNRGRLL